ncbi:MAG TPA: AMP-binding protein [Bradyrhizobium sp.]|nr:AMP-binding protein [Bradyrhizobium sp.]
MTVVNFLDRGSELSKDLPCLVEDDVSLTYREVVDWSHRIAWALDDQSIGAKSRVAVLTYNNIWGYVALLGLQRARSLWVPLNARSTIEENIGHMVRTQSEWLFFHSDFAVHVDRIRREVTTLKGVVCLDAPSAAAPEMASWARPAGCPAYPEPPTDPAEDDFRITSSGGTTGEPKAVVQTQRGVETGVATYLSSLRHEGRPRYLLCNPMTHAAGVASFHILALGGTIFFLRKPELHRVIEQIEQNRISMVILTPTTLYSLLAMPDLAKHDFSSLRYLMTGAAPVSASKLREAIKLFGPVVMQAFGQTEASPSVAMMLPDEYEACLRDPALEHRLHSCGRATLFAKLAIMGEDGKLLPPGERGELVVRSGAVMRGYWREGTLVPRNDKHGWHGTGDIAYRDEAGYFYIVDRIRDLIITGGFNVFPSEVEQVIWGHPSVEDCVVIGVPDEKWGEAVKAVVSLKSGSSLTETELIALCRERVGPVKAPKSIEFWNDLPKSALGKVLKKEVRAILQSRAAVQESFGRLDC